MSATVKLAKEIDEPDIGQPTAECQLIEKAGYKMRAPTRAGPRRRHQGACHDVAQ